MANVFQNPQKLATNGLGILLREIVVPATVTNFGGDNFRGAKNYSVDVPIRAKATSHRIALGATGSARNITDNDLSESIWTTKLTTHIYSSSSITLEQQTLDIRDFTGQVIKPQAESVAFDAELLVYEAIQNAPYHTDHVVTYDSSTGSAFEVFTSARKVLNKSNVPGSGRVMLVGPQAEYLILNDSKLDTTNPAGLGEGALRDAFIGRIAGFDIFTSNLVGDADMFAYHRSAFVYANLAPVVPQGAPAGKSVSQDGFGLTWVGDYNSSNSTDRSIVQTYAGADSVNDGRTATPAYVGGVAGTVDTVCNDRAVKIVIS